MPNRCMHWQITFSNASTDWVAHASRVPALASSPSRTFLVRPIETRVFILKKLVSARRRNQHARRVRYPELHQCEIRVDLFCYFGFKPSLQSQ